MFIDTHCHLSFEKLGSYGTTTLEVLERAKKQQVTKLIDIATDISGFATTLNFTNQHAGVFAAIGIHPLHILTNQSFQKEDITKHLQHHKLVAIGETGLDYYYSTDTKTLQHKFFEEHCEIASSSNLPIIIHTRAAFEDTLAILSNHVKNNGLTGVIHCFTGDKAFAKQVLDLGFYISFSGIVTFKKSLTLHEVAQYVPKQYILTETDAPYLAPVPFRGQDNEPAYVKYTAEFVANLREETVESFAEQVAENAKTLFAKLG